MIRKATAILALLMTVAVYQMDSASAENTPNVDEPSSPYNAYSFEKPQGFVDLLSWVISTYSTDPQSSRYLFSDTLKETAINYGKDKGKAALVFVIKEFDRYLLNTVVDCGTSLSLYTLDAGEGMELFVGLMEAEKLPFVENAPSGCDACNCVTWVRCARAPWLPYGLITLEDKKRAMNSSSADKGKVAVHDIYYPYGHVSYIYKVSGSKIYIEEANYSRCKVTSRSGSKSDLKIIGYIKKK